MSAATVEAVPSRRPDPVRPARQSYPPRYKLQILAGLDAAESKADRGAIMRREGLYSSLISAWRDQRDQGALAAMGAKRPGPKATRCGPRTPGCAARSPLSRNASQPPRS